MVEPAGVLGRIAEAKREELASRFDGVALDAVRSSARPTERSLRDAMERRGGRFILEIKRASPSGGAIRSGADPGKIARCYVGVADALSVLCDRPYFGGSLADLSAARGGFSGPIVAKDFFLDLRQVAEARMAGADAILVMLSLLDDEAARAMIAEASRFGMDALVEVHDEREMRRALRLGAPLIGINNRDLRDLSVDLRTTARLAPLAPDSILIAESGIASREDVERLVPFVGGFLVGSSLMRAPDPGEAARELVFGRVKLCGLNRPEDFHLAAPATQVGLVMVRGSTRALTLGQAMRFAPLHPRPVGIFRDAPERDVAEAAHMLGLAAVQLHGAEDAAYARALARKLPRDCEIWKAVEVGRSISSGFEAADRVLFDSGPGGTGRTFDWTLIRDYPALDRGLVAGGIGPLNARAARQLGAYAIDVGSAVDERPGVKSPEKIAALFEALRPASGERLRACA
jgi:indole-3-glycerol phosphate synthase/phosphoribosylanthranilate isomerase